MCLCVSISGSFDNFYLKKKGEEEEAEEKKNNNKKKNLKYVLIFCCQISIIDFRKSKMAPDIHKPSGCRPHLIGCWLTSDLSLTLSQ